MNNRILPPLCSLLIFAAHLHCVTGHGHAVVDGKQVVINDELPVAPSQSNGCEDATGCICKGATVAEPFDFADLELAQLMTWLCSDSPLSLEWVSSVKLPTKLCRRSFPSLPVRASDRCALLQSFLI
jgi:hypothetical protein